MILKMILKLHKYKKSTFKKVDLLTYIIIFRIAKAKLYLGNGGEALKILNKVTIIFRDYYGSGDFEVA